MPVVQQTQSAVPKGELAAEIFRRHVQALVPSGQEQWFLAIDVKSGQFEFDEDDYRAMSKLLARVPDADGFLMRANGSPAYKMRHAR